MPEVNRAGDHVPIAAVSGIVIGVDVEEPVLTRQQRGSLRGRLQRSKGMSNIQVGPDIRQTDRGTNMEHLAYIVEHDVGVGFVRLVFQTKAYITSMVSNRVGRVD